MLNPKTKERELCFVTKVDEIKELPGYDRVESARVGGWWCIVPKGQFKAGDFGVYFEIDSKVDTNKPEFAFLEKRHGKIKTQKMCKSISQGLLMSFDDFIHDGVKPIWMAAFEKDMNEDWENADSRFLTAALEVKYSVEEDNKRKANPDKYKSMCSRHPKIFKQKWARWMMRRDWGKKIMFLFFGRKKDKKTTFPTKFPYVKRSDEERVENMTYILENKTPFVKTTKIDGTSTSFILERKKFNQREFYVCSRNIRQLTPNQPTFHSDNVYWSVEKKYHIREFLEEMLKQHPEWEYVALQGETAGVGEDGGKIQGDPHQFGELRFFGYNFIDSIKGRWNSVEARNLVKKYGIEWVPIVCENYILPDNFEEFKKSADGECEAPGASGPREGYVYRNAENPNISFKNVSREYLLKH